MAPAKAAPVRVDLVRDVPDKAAPVREWSVRAVAPVKVVRARVGLGRAVPANRGRVVEASRGDVDRTLNRARRPMTLMAE